MYLFLCDSNSAMLLGSVHNLLFSNEVVLVKRKSGDVSATCQKIAAKYLVADAPNPVFCDHGTSEQDSLQSIYSYAR
jgi:hypothetical protein